MRNGVQVSAQPCRGSRIEEPPEAKVSSGLIHGALKALLHYTPYHDVDVVGKSELMTSRVAYDIFSYDDISRLRETLTGMRRESIYTYVLLST